MVYLPFYTETLVLPVTAKEVFRKLNPHILPEQEVLNLNRPMSNHLYMGTTGDSWFVIYRKIMQPDNFLPLIQGNVEGTSVGCLIFIRYSLFKSTVWFLIFWSLVSVGLGSYLLLVQRHYFWGFAAFLFGVINYLVTILNFNRNLEKDKALLHGLF